MKFFKPFTSPIDKKEARSNYWHNTMGELARINGKSIYLEEKLGKMTFIFYEEVSGLMYETMQDYEDISQESCMYCNKYCKQHRIHEDNGSIHLCFPCLVGDKITILLEKIIKQWRGWTNGGNGSLSYLG